jgi:sugar lactone lactonase YvrE
MSINARVQVLSPVWPLAAVFGLIIVQSAAWAQTPSSTTIPPRQVLVPGSVIHAVEGIAFGNDGYLYGTSIHAQVVYRIDTKSGEVTIAVPSPVGESDDVAIGPKGTPAEDVLAWTAQTTGEIRIQRPGQAPETILKNVPRVNPITFSPDGRLFTSQVGAGEDALWELDVTGAKPPRLVTKGQGPLNGFGFGPDGRIYAPLFRTDKLVAVNVETGAYEIVAQGVGTSAAAKVDANGDVISVDYLKGEVWRTDLKAKTSTKIATYSDVLDNIAIHKSGLIYFASVADSRILSFDPRTGVKRTVVDGRFTVALGSAMTTFNGKESLVVADPFGYRFVDPLTGDVTRPPWQANRGASSAVVADDKYIAFTYAGSNRVRVIDRNADKVAMETAEIAAPRGVALTSDHQVVVADASGNRIVMLNDKEVRTLAVGLRQPVALILENDSTALVSEFAAGAIARVNLSNGQKTLIAEGFVEPTGLAMLKDGRIAVVEAEKGRVTAINLTSGARQIIAEGLATATSSFHLPRDTNTGISVTSTGDVLVTCPKDNSVIKIDL